ncbi:hypothetical protein [Methylobacterium indicum]|uniref:Uncharacterized protein n=1 Tax=Methylobacterium indicum TaxID=1775910 RepID=A0A8H9C922_9HYPH|nr:hypothetical protein [Methylobacterium indicum]BCM87767.1 hypothetical protein mvi_62280 [Methylobacterium indicum]
MNHHDIIEREMPAGEKLACAACILLLWFAFVYGLLMLADAVIKSTH